MNASDNLQCWRTDDAGTLVVQRLVNSTHAYPLHSHDDVYGVGVMEMGGCYCVKAGQEASLATPGELAFFNPGQVHSGIPYRRNVYTYKMFYIGQEAMKAALRELADKDRPPEFRRLIVQDRELSEKLNALHRSLADGSGPLSLQSALLETCVRIVAKHANVSPKDSGPHEPGAVKRAVEFLNDRLGEKISLEELANAAGLSRYHLIRVFKKSCGLTPHAYLTQQRINRASSLLKSGETPLSEIALATGFTDQCHFTKTFRSLTGATPGRFRTAWRNRAG